MTAFSQYQYIQALKTILIQATAIKHNEISAIAFRDLLGNGLGYSMKDGKVLIEIDGETYLLPGTILETINTSTQPEASSMWLDNLISDIPSAKEVQARNTDFFSDEKERTVTDAKNVDKEMSDFLDAIFSGDTDTSTLPENKDFDTFAFSQSKEDNVSTDACYEQKEPVLPENPLPSEKPSEISPLAEEVGFSRKTANIAPIKRGRMVEEVKSDIEEGYQPPLTDVFTPNYEISIQDCVYSMFMGEVYEETAIKKQKIYFMVAPFEIKDNDPSCNIIMYAFYNGQSYAITSLSSPNKNSLLCQIAEFQFLVRGKFQDGVWSADIQLTKDSLRRRDVFTVEKVYHSNPATIGKTNGHIRFTYEGYINHKNLKSKGCVNVFPVDVEASEFIIVRCIEDFIDIIFTEEKPLVELHTHEGDKCLSILSSGGVFQAHMEDSVKEEEDIFSV